MPKKYPLEFKKQAIRRYEKGESIPALCQELPRIAKHLLSLAKPVPFYSDICPYLHTSGV